MNDVKYVFSLNHSRISFLYEYSGTTDIVTLSCSYIPDIDTSKSLNTAYGAKDQVVL
jgi:hypothetical protein